MKKLLVILLPLLLLALVIGCGKKPELDQETMPIDRTTIDDSSTTTDPGTDPGVERDPLDIFKTVYFDFDKYNLRSDAKRDLQHNVEVMKKNTDWKILIAGHCDERGTVEYNLALGEKRARSARDYLTSLGIDANRIEIISYGKEKPADYGHTETAWSLNRRAVFTN